MEEMKTPQAERNESAALTMETFQKIEYKRPDMGAMKKKLKQLLRMPAGSHPVAILCIGHVTQFYDKPMLEQEKWATRADLSALVSDNKWPE